MQWISFDRQTLRADVLAIPMETAFGGGYMDWLDQDHVLLAPISHEWIAILRAKDFGTLTVQGTRAKIGPVASSDPQRLKSFP